MEYRASHVLPESDEQICFKCTEPRQIIFVKLSQSNNAIAELGHETVGKVLLNKEYLGVNVCPVSSKMQN